MPSFVFDLKEVLARWVVILDSLGDNWFRRGRRRCYNDWGHVFSGFFLP
jgi:hypothetical protein